MPRTIDLEVALKVWWMKARDPGRQNLEIGRAVGFPGLASSICDRVQRHLERASFKMCMTPEDYYAMRTDKKRRRAFEKSIGFNGSPLEAAMVVQTFAVSWTKEEKKTAKDLIIEALSKDDETEIVTVIDKANIGDGLSVVADPRHSAAMRRRPRKK